VHPAGAVLDEYQDIQSLQQRGVDVQEVDGDDPGGLGVQELPPGWARAARRRADACSSQDLIDGGGRDRDAELGQLAVLASRGRPRPSTCGVSVIRAAQDLGV
jgi:hypothetical protein